MITEPPPNPTKAAAAVESASLLVVDDSEANRDVLCRRLRRHGYTVTIARNGEEALALVEQAPFDLILLDIMMPGLNGLEVLQRLRQAHPATELPVIMASAKDQSEDIVHALELGASDYVTKPIDFAVALARVRTHLALKQAVGQVVDLSQRLNQRNAELEAANARMRRNLEAASRIQAAFLPQSPPMLAGLDFAWTYLPCEALAGDFLNVCALDDSHAALYVLDVSGHGVAAALLAVTLSRLLSPANDPNSLLLREGADADRMVSPAEVAERLNQKFPYDEATEQFFTILYGIIDAQMRTFRYISAGHPGIVHVRPDAPPELHISAGLPIGLGGVYEEKAITLNAGDRLYLYSDGVTDAMNPDGRPFGNDRLLQAFERERVQPLRASVQRLVDELREWCGGAPFRDDLSVLAVEALP